MTNLDYYFLSILKECYKQDHSDLLSTDRDFNDKEFFDLAISQNTLPFVTDYLYQKNPSFSLLPIMKEYTKQQMLKYYQLEAFTCRIYDLLTAHDIPFVLLKGISLSAVYPKSDYRISSDVDIYIKDKHDFSRATRVFLDAGFATEDEMDPDQKCDHHVCFYETSGPKTFILELHYHITGKVQFEPANQVIENVFETNLATTTITLTERDFQVLEPTSYMFYLLYHMLKHYLSKGLNMKLLLDLLYFGNAMRSQINYEQLTQWCKESGLHTFYRTVFSCLVIYFDFSWDGTLVPAKNCEAFMDKVLHFNETNSSAQLNRSRVYEKVNLMTYLREGHYQMKANYPKVSKCFFLWPVLWLFTLIIFIRNNKTIRKSSTREVIEQFKKQNDQTNDILLFENDM